MFYASEEHAIEFCHLACTDVCAWLVIVLLTPLHRRQTATCVNPSKSEPELSRWVGADPLADQNLAWQASTHVAFVMSAKRAGLILIAASMSPAAGRTNGCACSETSQ